MGAKRKMPRGVSIRKHKTCETIQINFYYKGVRCRESLGLSPTRGNIAHANKKLSNIESEIELGTFRYADYFPNSPKLKVFGLQTSGATVEHYMDEYINNAKKRGLSHTTINGYQKAKSALSKLLEITVSELSANDVLTYVKTAKVSQKTIRNRVSVLRSSLDQAVIEGLIKINPVSAIKISLYTEKQKKTNTRGAHKDVDIFYPAEIANILDHAKPVTRNIIQLVFNTGLRSGEWAALKWHDVDLSAKELLVFDAYTEGMFTSPKSAAGCRTIPLNDTAINALKAQKEHTFSSSEYVFLNSRGRPWNTETFRKGHWKSILESAEVRYRRPYQMRHTFATMHISQNENLWQIAKWMGHTSPEMLFRHYGNFVREFQNSDGNSAPHKGVEQNKKHIPH
ncbi:tyrosine-type recombinase/integrase [Thalassotalea litorea]|uniref:tyrosine-type recombinase/integrase n=1 Tax=Thalassotalea litorea TaxID=2020715 RepID=UPI003736D9A1